MATYSTGITATWNATPFTEVVDLSWSYGGGLPKGRASPWTDELGSVSVTCLGSANTSTANYGIRGDLLIAGGGAALTHKAVWEGISVAPELNGVTKYTVTFRLVDN